MCSPSLQHRPFSAEGRYTQDQGGERWAGHWQVTQTWKAGKKEGLRGQEGIKAWKPKTGQVWLREAWINKATHVLLEHLPRAETRSKILTSPLSPLCIQQGSSTGQSTRSQLRKQCGKSQQWEPVSPHMERSRKREKSWD